jgi:hypothetical protein
VTDTPTSNTDGFLPRETLLLPFTSVQVFCTKMMILTLENPEK